jgi:hypothetical protein
MGPRAHGAVCVYAGGERMVPEGDRGDVRLINSENSMIVSISCGVPK